MRDEPLTLPNRNCRSRRRFATSVLEVIVSLTLLMSVLSVSLPLIVRHGHLLMVQQHYRLALDELSNQLDRLMGIPAEDVPQALNQLSVSPFTSARLVGAKLNAEMKPAEIGQSVTMRLTWKDSQEQSATMTGWVLPSRQAQR
jgi:hypothetical protein